MKDNLWLTYNIIIVGRGNTLNNSHKKKTCEQSKINQLKDKKLQPQIAIIK